MLIEFAVTNFRSFKERQVLSLLPSGKIRERYVLPLQSERYAKVKVLPTAVLYGKNNVGKSNFLRAVFALQWLVSESSNFNSDKKLDANEFFWFDKKTKNNPTTFEIDFIAPNKKRYTYIVKFNREEIVEEALYLFNISATEKRTLITLFQREKQNIKFPALKGIKESIYFAPNQLFLSKGDAQGNKELREVYSFFAEHLFVYQFTETEYTNFLTKKYAEFVAENPADTINDLVEMLLKETDTGILGIETNLVDVSKILFPDNTPQELKDKVFEQLKYEIRTRHKLFDGENEIGEDTLPLSEQSIGTRKLLGLIPLIIPSLKDGDTLFIDEMNTSMHTRITTWLIDLFNNPETNPNNAQLIITTHDIVLLDKELYEKDQVFVVEKNKNGASEMYSFADITGLRAKDNTMDFYETGRLGGVPHIAKSYLTFIINKFLTNAKNESK